MTVDGSNGTACVRLIQQASHDQTNFLQRPGCLSNTVRAAKGGGNELSCNVRQPTTASKQPVSQLPVSSGVVTQHETEVFGTTYTPNVEECQPRGYKHERQEEDNIRYTT